MKTRLVATLIVVELVEEEWHTLRCSAECVGLYPVLLSDQKEGTLQTAVTETQPEEKAKRSSMCLYFIHHIDLWRYGYKPRGCGLPFREFSLKRFTARVFGVPCREQKKKHHRRYLTTNIRNGRYWKVLESIVFRYWKLWVSVNGVVLELVPLRGEKSFTSHPHFLGVIFEISVEHPVLFV